MHNLHTIQEITPAFFSTCTQLAFELYNMERTLELGQADMAVSNCAALKMELCAYLPLRKTKKEQPSSSLMAKYNAQCAKNI